VKNMYQIILKLPGFRGVTDTTEIESECGKQTHNSPHKHPPIDYSCIFSKIVSPSEF